MSEFETEIVKQLSQINKHLKKISDALHTYDHEDESRECSFIEVMRYELDNTLIDINNSIKRSNGEM